MHWRRIYRHLLGSVGIAIIAIAIVAVPVWATSAAEIPPPNEEVSVIDQGNVLSRVTQSHLKRLFQQVAKDTGIHAHFVTVHRLDYGETPQTFVDTLFTEWFPDATAQANQVIVALDTVTNGTAIRYGDAVAQVLSPEIADSIVQETMRVPLRDGNYNQSFLDAGNRLAKVLQGEPDPGPPVIREVVTAKTYKSKSETDDRSATIIVVSLLIAATVIPMVTYFIYQGSS